MRRLVSYVVISVTLMLLGVWAEPIGQAQRRKLSAVTIVERMLNRYTTLSSYEDKGTVRVLNQDPRLVSYSHSRVGPAVPDQIVVTFKTYYMRPNRFRFDWRGSNSEERDSMIWTDGRDFYSWMPVGGVNNDSFTLRNRTNLRVSIEDSRLSSMGANYFIPSLLMKDAGYVSFAESLRSMTQMSVVGRESLDGEVCFLIKGKMHGEPFLFWIGTRSYLLRKIRTVYARPPSFDKPGRPSGEQVIAEETHYDIRINKPVHERVFRVNPKNEPH